MKLRHTSAPLAAAAGAVLLLAALLVSTWLVPRLATSRIQDKLTRELPERLGRAVTVEQVSVSLLGRVVLRGLTVAGANPSERPVLQAPRIELGLRWWPLLLGRARIDSIRIERPVASASRAADGTIDVVELARRLRRKRDGGDEPTGGGLPSVTIEHAALHLRDQPLGVSLDAPNVTTTLQPGKAATIEVEEVELTFDAGPRAEARFVRARVPLDARGRPTTLPSVEIEGGAVSPWAGFTLTGISGSIQPKGLLQADVDLQGGYGGVDKALWTARGTLKPQAGEGSIELRAQRFRLDQLSAILKDAPVVRPDQAHVDARLLLSYASGTLQFDGFVDTEGLSVAHPGLAAATVRNLVVSARTRGRFVLAERRVEFDTLQLELGKLRAELRGYASGLGSRTALKLDMTLQVPPLPCQEALDALPTAIVPALQGFRLRGMFDVGVHVAFDMQHLEDLVLDGSVGIAHCHVDKAAPAVDAHRLLGPFEHTVEIEPDKLMSFEIGPDDPDYTTLDQVAPYFINSLLTTEDGGFFRHHGYLPSVFRTVLKENLERGYFRLGGSSITMQMVKNVLLTRDKTLSRKLQELFLSWYVETVLDKRRILEIYVNAIEFGPGIYGIGRAARHYFGKRPIELTPLESAFFSSILPSPKRRYVYYCRGALTPQWDRYIRRIMAKSEERGLLAPDEAQGASLSTLVFDRREAMSERDCLALIKHLVEATSTEEAPEHPAP